MPSTRRIDAAPHSEVASWDGFGHRAANGGRFAPDSLIAVHRSLPIGTRVRVTYGGRSVFVRINDRGPFIAGRVIDLSRWAARATGLSGVGRVHLAIRGRNGAQHGSLSDRAPSPEAREGERLTAYKDSVDVWTIGTGIANVSDLIVGKPGLTITKAQ
ncbi:rare lipoprotein A [Methylobacterium sp. 275MFSha3.1]|nr:rare lipoprotein A [Methylobacterium sp. 275MFSha3.1]